MTHSEQVSFYEKRVLYFSEKVEHQTSIINRVSVFRLLTAAGVMAAIYFSIQHTEFIFLVLVLTGFFIGLVQWHSRLFDEKVLLENFVVINKAEIRSLQRDYSYQPRGNEFLNPQHSYSYDLDIFGEGSLFQYINRASTAGGRQWLARLLQFPLSSADAVLEQQRAIQELSNKVEFRQLLQATATNIKDTPDDKSALLNWLQQPALLYGKTLFRYALTALPAATLFCIAGSFFAEACKPAALLLVLVQWGIVGLYHKRITLFHDYVSRKKSLLDKYGKIIAVFNNEKFSSAKLQQLSDATHQAETRMANLARLVGALDARLNFMTSLVMNATLLYDLQCVYRLEQWKEVNGAQLESWLNAISEKEMLISYATYAYNHPSYCYAALHESLSIKGLAMAHPLLSEEERVVNDLFLGSPQSVLVITGANMAGKSTFLRTLGVNVVLALNGAPVCASEFVCPVLEIRSGMRTTDSLKDHQSYFYAELNRLKSIMDELQQEKPLLILLDEILKGTNSTDKQTGSIALVKQLMQHRSLAIVATHDLALGELEKSYPERVKNYHFEPTIENDKLSFDYRLKSGIAEKMNATFLMTKMGIIPNSG
jgi:DNA mismatch repair ATPase MutS